MSESLFYEETDDPRRIVQLDRLKKLAWLLGLFGLVPFVICALMALVLGTNSPLVEPLITIFRNYSVVILSFLGGIRWGHALLRKHDDQSLVDNRVIFFSVVPALTAWATMFFQTTPAIAILLLAFCAQGAWDSIAAHSGGLPKWMAPLRIVLTVVVALCHMIIFIVSA